MDNISHTVDITSSFNRSSESPVVTDAMFIERPLWKDTMLEFFGTYLFVYISLAGVNQIVLSGSGDQFHIAVCFAVGLASGVVVANKSGAHLNPAITFSKYLFEGEVDAKKMISYILAQVFGGFMAGLTVLAVYYSWINNLPDVVSIGSFGTIKNDNNSLISAIVDQFIGSALLMFGITYTSNPIIIGMILGGLGMFQGTNGFAFNLARDFGPRVASSIVFGSDTFKLGGHWFWVPMVVPFIGVPFGLYMSKLLKNLN